MAAAGLPALFENPVYAHLRTPFACSQLLWIRHPALLDRRLNGLHAHTGQPLGHWQTPHGWLEVARCLSACARQCLKTRTKSLNTRSKLAQNHSKLAQNRSKLAQNRSKFAQNRSTHESSLLKHVFGQWWVTKQGLRKNQCSLWL